MNKKLFCICLCLIAAMLVACNDSEPAPPPEQPAPTQTPEAETEPTEASEEEASVAEAETSDTTVIIEGIPASGSTEPTAAEAVAEATDEPTATPHPAAQVIGAFTEPSQTNGDLLILYGQVLDVNDNPVPEAVVEIWQTDENGIYDHPDDPTTAGRDTTFQFFGRATANAEGWYAFRTILPGEYEPRPRHIHYKVKQNDITLLTSQFYFSDDIAKVEGEGMFRAVGESGDLLLLQLVAGDQATLANGRIVVDTGVGSGTLPLTPAQGEGPYYPVVSLANYDNDLTNLP